MHRSSSLSGRAGRRAAGVVLLCALSSMLITSSAEANPTAGGFGPGIEPYARYEGQSECSPWAKPGVLAFREAVLAAYPSTGAGGIERGCEIGGQSEHKEGRAWDWGVNVEVPEEKAAADSLIEWLIKPDRFGNDAAMARRVGIMYLIWNREIWFPGSGWRIYCKQKDFGCHVPGDQKSLRHPHTDHVHFSFTWDGARKRTTFWKKNRSLLDGGATPGDGGYWLLARNGGVAAVGLPHLGSSTDSRKAVVGVASVPDAEGYWLVTRDGRVARFGYLDDHGGVDGRSKKIEGIVATPSGNGYWIYARRGRVFAFGGAAALGGLGAAGEVVAGMAATSTGEGYWLVTEQGRVQAFGDASHLGDLAGSGVVVSGIESTPSGAGYWLVTNVGAVHAYGDAQDLGDLSEASLNQSIVDLVGTRQGNGYWLIGSRGKVEAFGDAPSLATRRTYSSMHRTAAPTPPAGSPLD